MLPLFVFFFTPLSISAQFDGSLTRSLYFASDKTDLTVESQKTLSELSDSLAKFSAYALHIEGNTDADAAEEYNKKLSSARVEATRFFLINRGVPQDAFNKKDALGESKPIADNISDDGKQRNRRTYCANSYANSFTRYGIFHRRKKSTRQKNGMDKCRHEQYFALDEWQIESAKRL